jgi:acyl CoA:acetate/3-ketoacid CoA transferase beta subunit
MGSQCTKLTPCCLDSQFKAAVVEVPSVGGSKTLVFSVKKVYIMMGHKLIIVASWFLSCSRK